MTASEQPRRETALILSYHIKGMDCWTSGEVEYSYSQMHRTRSLIFFKNCGVNFLKIKEMFQGSSRFNPLDTDMGTYNSFENFLDVNHSKTGGNKLGKTQIKKYIRLAENWDVAEELKLTESEACYRLEATMSIIKWGLKKREAGYDLTTLDHHLYFQELAEGKLCSDKDKPLTLYDKKLLLLEAENRELKLEVSRLKAELSLRLSS